MSKPFTFKFQYNGLEAETFGEFYSRSCADFALREEVKHYIEDNELLNERTQLVAAGKMALLRLGRYISDASAAPLTNGNVEKLVKLVALLESAENDFIYS